MCFFKTSFLSKRLLCLNFVWDYAPEEIEDIPQKRLIIPQKRLKIQA